MLDPTLATYGFTWLDWLVLIGYLTLTTVLGAKLAGKNTTIREFFLGGRKLPWWAVAGFDHRDRDLRGDVRVGAVGGVQTGR
jgi:hypothetical protein